MDLKEVFHLEEHVEIEQIKLNKLNNSCDHIKRFFNYESVNLSTKETIIIDMGNKTFSSKSDLGNIIVNCLSFDFGKLLYEINNQKKIVADLELKLRKVKHALKNIK